MPAMYHVTHLIAADAGPERIGARRRRTRRLPFGVLMRGARMLRRAPRVAA
jgi:hypothetical protein